MFKKIFITCIAVLFAGITDTYASAPVINSIYADPSVIFPGRSTLITVNVNSTDNGGLVFTYSASAGSFITWDGNHAQWLSPLVGGDYTISVTVSSTLGGQSFTFVSVDVILAFFKGLIRGLQNPVYLAVDENGNLYVSQPEASTISSFDYNGYKRFDITINNKPGPIAVMHNVLYVVLKSEGLISLYSAMNGIFLNNLCSYNRFNNPSGITVDRASNIIYISDANGIHSIDMACNSISNFTYQQMGMPVGMDFDSSVNNLAVADALRASIVLINTVGATITEVGQYGLQGNIGWSGFNPGFDNNPSLTRPVGVAEDDFGRYYVADAYQNGVFVYTQQNQFMGTIGYYGTEAGAFKNPTSVAIDKTHGLLYIADPFNNRIVSYGIDKSSVVPPQNGFSCVPTEFQRSAPPNTQNTANQQTTTTVTTNEVLGSKSAGCSCSTSFSNSLEMDGLLLMLTITGFICYLKRYYVGKKKD